MFWHLLVIKLLPELDDGSRFGFDGVADCLHFVFEFVFILCNLGHQSCHQGLVRRDGIPRKEHVRGHLPGHGTSERNTCKRLSHENCCFCPSEHAVKYELLFVPGVEQKIPKLAPGVENSDLFVATTMSQIETSWQPAAAAWPSTAAITGTGEVTISFISWLHVRKMVSWCSFPSEVVISLRLCPAEKTEEPAEERRTTQRMSSEDVAFSEAKHQFLTIKQTNGRTTSNYVQIKR